MKNLPVAELQACVNTRNANRVTVHLPGGTQTHAFAPGELLLTDISADPDEEGGWHYPRGRCVRVADLILSRILDTQVYDAAVWPDCLELELGR